MLARSNSFVYLGGVQKYRDLNNLAINFGPLAQIISRMPWIMSSKPLSRPGGMKGQFCKKISKTIGAAYVFAGIVTFSWYLGVQNIRKDVHSEFNSFNDFDEDAVYERIKSKGLFWAIFYNLLLGVYGHWSYEETIVKKRQMKKQRLGYRKILFPLEIGATNFPEILFFQLLEVASKRM